MPGDQRSAPLQALGRPQLRGLVVLGHRRRLGRQHHPGLLRGGVDVHVGREPVGLVERADADEANRIAAAAVVAPDARSGRSGSARCAGPCRCSTGVSTTSTSPASSCTRSASIRALRANAVPVSRWHQRQWQQCTKSGRLAHAIADPATGAAAVEEGCGRSVHVVSSAASVWPRRAIRREAGRRSRRPWRRPCSPSAGAAALRG